MVPPGDDMVKQARSKQAGTASHKKPLAVDPKIVKIEKPDPIIPIIGVGIQGDRIAALGTVSGDARRSRYISACRSR